MSIKLERQVQDLRHELGNSRQVVNFLQESVRDLTNRVQQLEAAASVPASKKAKAADGEKQAQADDRRRA